MERKKSNLFLSAEGFRAGRRSDRSEPRQNRRSPTSQSRRIRRRSSGPCLCLWSFKKTNQISSTLPKAFAQPAGRSERPQNPAPLLTRFDTPATTRHCSCSCLLKNKSDFFHSAEGLRAARRAKRTAPKSPPAALRNSWNFQFSDRLFSIPCRQQNHYN